MGERGKIKVFLSGKVFLWLIIVFIFSQSVWTAASLRYKVPPDESYHFQLISYYADRPITAGPFISNQGKKVFILGDIQRTPNYIYQYLLSFPLKAIRHITSNINYQVFALRLISIAFFLMALFILYKILALIRLSQLKINLVFFTLSLTGMFVWMSAAVNYDNMGLPLFWGYLYVLLLLTKKVKAQYLIALALLAITDVLTITMYGPILIIAPLIMIALNYKKIRQANVGNYITSWKKEFTRHNPVIWVLVILLIVASGLFVERIGYNLVRYHSLAPSCARLHPASDCMQNSLYARAVQQDKVVAELKKTDEMPQVMPMEFTAQWLDSMYTRIYFYTGSQQLAASVHAEDVAAFTAVLVLIVLVLKQSKLRVSKNQKFLFYVALSYLLVIFIYNLGTYISTASMFGYQGRYLLPALPFMYAFAALLFANVIKDLSGISRKTVIAAIIILGILNIYYLAPPLVMLRGANASWYTPKTASFNNDVGKIMHAIKIVNPNSLKNI